MPDGRRYDADASRAAILEAAEKLFMKNGFAATSVAALAKAAGVTKSLIHHHFGSKENLWEAVKHAMFAEFHEQQMTMLQKQATDEQLLENSFRLYFGFLRTFPNLRRLKAWMDLEQTEMDRTCEDMDFELMKLGVERIREGQELGLIRADVPAPFILISFLGLAESWFSGRSQTRGALVAGGVLDPAAGLETVDDQFLDYAIRLFFDGVRPRN